MRSGLPENRWTEGGSGAAAEMTASDATAARSFTALLSYAGRPIMGLPMSIWERLAGRKLDVKFTGAPATRRIKSYTALSGYSYQYYFDGRRDLETSKEYRFQVSSNARLYK